MEKRRWNDELEVEERKIADQARMAERWQYLTVFVVVLWFFPLLVSLYPTLPKYPVLTNSGYVRWLRRVSGYSYRGIRYFDTWDLL